MAEKPTYEELEQRIRTLELIEEEAKRSEQKYKDLVASLPQIVFETDLAGNVSFANRTAFDLFGYTQKDYAKGLNALDMMVPEERDRALKNMQAIMNGEVLGGVEYTVVRKDGHRFPVVVHSNRFFQDNKPAGLRGLIVDLSQIKMMETALKRRAMAIDQSTETIVITDAEGLITYVNPAFEKITGYSSEEALGENPRILRSGKHDDMFYRDLWKTISGGKTWSGRLVNIKKNGSEFTEEATISPVFSDKGEIVSYVAVKRDITDKLQLEAQLQQAQKMEAIGSLAGGIAHDFNNILSPIFGYTEMLLLEAPEGSQLRQGLTRILAGARTARNLVAQILAFSRQSDHEKKPLKMQSVIEEDLKLVRSLLPVTIKISRYISNNCGLVMADPTQMSQVLMNLCTNAFHSMEETKGTLTVTLKKIELETRDLMSPEMVPGTYVCLTVADTGSGIDSHILPRIFDPYFTTKDKDKGTGLGLAIIHGIVKGHNGHISVSSEPGKGAEFRVYLPAIEAICEAEHTSSQAVSGGDERILLVEDKKDVLDIEQQLLEFLGYRVTARSSSQDALELFKVRPDSFDLVLTDLTMPNMSGDELAGELIKIRPEIPIILCSGFSEVLSESRAAALGIRGMMMKPVTMNDLSRVIRDVLDTFPEGKQPG